jgi:hypothetical protein
VYGVTSTGFLELGGAKISSWKEAPEDTDTLNFARDDKFWLDLMGEFIE